MYVSSFLALVAEARSDLSGTSFGRSRSLARHSLASHSQVQNHGQTMWIWC